MAAVVYRAPDGSTIENPTSEALADIVLRRPAGYWKYGSGDSGLTREDVDETLVFFVVEPFGVYVAFVPEGQVEVVPTTMSETKAVAAHRVCGEPMIRPQACFLPRELAFEVICEFATTGRRLRTLDWLPLHQLEYEDPRWPPPDGSAC